MTAGKDSAIRWSIPGNDTAFIHASRKDFRRWILQRPSFDKELDASSGCSIYRLVVNNADLALESFRLVERGGTWYPFLSEQDALDVSILRALQKQMRQGLSPAAMSPHLRHPMKTELILEYSWPGRTACGARHGPPV